MNPDKAANHSSEPTANEAGMVESPSAKFKQVINNRNDWLGGGSERSLVRSRKAPIDIPSYSSESSLNSSFGSLNASGRDLNWEGANNKPVNSPSPMTKNKVKIPSIFQNN